jgi:predicted O-linked N-acetylglucosamine transferase (SPINDLY family)
MDFEPPSGERFYRERLVRLANIGVCYTPPELALADVDLVSLGLSASRPIALCPGTPFKYVPASDQLFVEIAKKAPMCQLVLFDDGRGAFGTQLRNRLEIAFATAGLKFDAHIVVISWLDRARWRGLLARSTVVLDTIGFSGFNTAAQALAAAVPVVAWNGKFLRGRLASGLLRRIGLGEWIAESIDDYVALVARLCDSPAIRERVSAEIAIAKWKAFDDLEPIRDLENFLLEKCRRQPGKAFRANQPRLQ